MSALFPRFRRREELVAHLPHRVHVKLVAVKDNLVALFVFPLKFLPAEQSVDPMLW